MRYCDITLAYNEGSGGIKTYINQKRKYIQNNTSDEHLLIIPGSDDDILEEERLTTVTIQSPKVPWRETYRFFWRPDKIKDVFEEYLPDVIELGSFFVAPLPAFRFRKHRKAEGKPCVVSAYFHTDVADAYFGGPLHRLFDGSLSGWNDILGKIGDDVTDAVEQRAESYFGNLFMSCDIVFAAGHEQLDRLEEYGVTEACEIPLGVDTDIFHPGRMGQEFRRQISADEDSTVFIYGGRLDSEKRVEILVDAFQKLNLKKSILVLMGEGPLKDTLKKNAEKTEGLIVCDYENDREKYAARLASADVYVTAGPHETFGLAVIEAMACGLPVVGVDAGALPERIPAETGFLTSPGDVEEFAENMKQAAQDKERLGEQARKYVLNEDYGWDSSFKTMLGIYSETFKKIKEMTL